MADFLTTREVAESITRSLALPAPVEEWQVRRVFEDGMLPEPPKFGGKRVLTPGAIPGVVDALRNRGWIPQAVEACA